MGKKVYGIIYKITNKINNKIYIGQTVRTFDKRYKSDLEKFTHNEHLKRSIKKYGIENFEIDKEFDIAYSKEELDNLEDMYIKLYKTTNIKFGYNKKFGGANGIYTNEIKQKISEALKGKNNPNYGKSLSNEHKQRLSESMKGKNIGRNTVWYGKHFSKEHKQKIGDALKGKNAKK